MYRIVTGAAMARILIAGCGATGAAVGVSLAQNGHNVVGLKRNPPADQQGIRYCRVDLTRAADLQGMDADYDLVIYILAPDDRTEASYVAVFDVGVENLLAMFSRQRRHTRFLFVSSTSVYGQSQGEWVDEESQTVPASSQARTILQAERRFLAFSPQNCIVRFSGIYGRGRPRLLNTVINSKEVQYEPPYYTNRIHWQDCVQVLCFVAGKMIKGEELESVYLASDDDPAPRWEVFNYLADKLGIEPPQKAILAQGASQNKRCDNRRLKQLGYSFQYPGYRDGYGAVSPSDIEP